MNAPTVLVKILNRKKEEIAERSAKASIDILKKRDTKGLYNAADSGQIDDLIGYSLINPFEKPNDADLIINTDDSSLLNFSKQSLLDFIKSVSN